MSKFWAKLGKNNVFVKALPQSKDLPSSLFDGIEITKNAICLIFDVVLEDDQELDRKCPRHLKSLKTLAIICPQESNLLHLMKILSAEFKFDVVRCVVYSKNKIEISLTEENAGSLFVKYGNVFSMHLNSSLRKSGNAKKFMGNNCILC